MQESRESIGRSREIADEGRTTSAHGQDLSAWTPVLAIHHDKSIWPQRVVAHEFKPERFVAGRRPAFLPFARAGVRTLVEFNLVISALAIYLIHGDSLR